MNNGDLFEKEVLADDLTWREQEILILLAERQTNREIADQLHLAESTIKDYVGKIFSKLYVKNRREAVKRAKDLGLLDHDQEILVKPQTNLPAEPTPFVGRNVEIRGIRQQLGKTRLLTLTGPGGIGKTRLAMKAGEEAAAEFEDGCFFVPLAPIRSVDHIVQTIAEVVKFPLATHEDPQHQLLRYLENKQLLLIIDNFEHLLDGVGIVSTILLVAPGVKILATSREKLSLQSETIFNVAGMAYPDQVGSKDNKNYDAITLFVQSANKVRPGFNPSPKELDQITNSCQIVQGMPLAIELAAAWLQILTVHEIAEELDKGLDILETEIRDAPERHRSIRAVFDHSWSLLPQTEQEIFMLISVFRGGFTREAAHQVAGASLQQLVGLVNKSFLNHDPDTGRLEIHELLRQYAQEKLGEQTEASRSTQEAHAAYYAEFMQQRWEHLKGKRQLLALTEIEADIENVRAAWRYYLDQRNAPKMWMFINGLWQVYWIRGWYHAGMELFAEATRFQGEEEESVALQALAMAHQAWFMSWLGLSEQGYELAKESVEILQQLNHPAALGFAYDSLFLNAFFLNRIAEESEAISIMLKIATEIDDKRLFTFALFGASMIALIKEDYTEAKRLAELSLNLNEEMGNVINSVFPLISLGHVAYARGEFQEARKSFQRCLKISKQIGFHWAIADSSKYLGKVDLSMGNVAEAEIYLVQSLKITDEIGFIRDTLILLFEFAQLQVALGNIEQATELLAFVIQHPTSDQFRWLDGHLCDSAKGLIAELEGELPQETYEAALERGQDLDLDEVIVDLVGPKNQ